MGLIGMPWVWLRRSWEESNGRVFVKGKAWKSESGREWVYDVFFLRFWFYCFMIYYYFFNVMLTWKIIGASKASVLYIYIYIYIDYILNPKGDSRVKDCVFFMCYTTVSLGSSVFLGLHELALCPISKSLNYWDWSSLEYKTGSKPKIHYSTR